MAEISELDADIAALEVRERSWSISTTQRMKLDALKKQIKVKRNKLRNTQRNVKYQASYREKKKGKLEALLKSIPPREKSST